MNASIWELYERLLYPVLGEPASGYIDIPFIFSVLFLTVFIYDLIHMIVVLLEE